MDFETYDCDRCGGNLTEIDAETYKCQYCGKVFRKKDAEEQTKTFRDMFDDIKREHINNLRRNLYDAVNTEYISSFDVKMRCEELKKYLPDDFSACFYEVAVGNNVRQLTKYIRKIDIEKNYDEIECVVKFLVKSLQTEYQLELNNLIARAYERRDPEKFEKYCTMLSEEAIKVDNGVYETKLPREVFIAYSSKDMEKVSELCEFLESQNLKCFVAARNLRHGKGAVENYNKALAEAMDHCKCVVFVSSMNSRNFNCDALTIELPYMQQKDIEAAPSEYRNNYKAMPQQYKKPRVEYRIGESLSRNVADSISDEIFDGYERVYSPEEVAQRVMKQLVAAAEIKKADKKTQSSQTIVQVATNDGGVSKIDPILKRARISIGDGEWNEALNACDRALDIDPECADIYVLKLMIDMRVKTQSDLAQLDDVFDDNMNFKKAIRFSDEELAATLNGYIKTIKERNEAEFKNTIYSKACELMARDDVLSYNAAIVEFNKIPDWRDSRAQLAKCNERIEFFKERAEEKRKAEIYAVACDLMLKDEVRHVEDARARFDRIRGWNDADEKIRECDELIEKLKLRDAENEHMAKVARAAAEAKAKKIKKIALIALAAVIMLVIGFVVINELVIKPDAYADAYADAIELYEKGDFSEAARLFEKVGEKYEKAKEYIAYCEFATGKPQKLINYIQSQGIELINIPQGTTTICDNAFRGCTGIKEVVIPESVTTIGNEAFNGCESLEKIVIPDKVTTIGDYAFRCCFSLTSIEIPDRVTSIGNRAFYYCKNLTTVKIGDRVTSIGEKAFYDCDSLTIVHYTGSEEQWAEINIGSDNSPLTNATIVYNYVP